MTETSVIVSLLGAISSVFGSHFLSIYGIFQRNTMKTAAVLYTSFQKHVELACSGTLCFVLIIKIIIRLHVDTIRSIKEKSKDPITFPSFPDLSSQ